VVRALGVNLSGFYDELTRGRAEFVARPLSRTRGWETGLSAFLKALSEHV